MRIKIVGSLEQEVNEGEEGELVIYSPYLTDGYLNAKNAAFKVEEKLSGSSIKSYKTGDKFIKIKDKLYYLGRAHHLAPIKVRGQLVDPSGTENLLRQHSALQDACVVIRYDLGPDAVLVAFIVSTEMPKIEDLRKFCLQSLTVSLVPSYFIPIDKLPVTINGKIDREALSKRPFTLVRNTEFFYVAADSLLKNKLVSIWQETLDPLQKLNIAMGIKDSFMSLGGDSIKAMILLGLIKKYFDLSLKVNDIGPLDKLTIENLAHMAQEELIKKHVSGSMRCLKKGDKSVSPLFFLPPISGLGTLTYESLAQQLKTSREIYAIDALSLSEPCLNYCSIPEIANLFLKVIRTVQPDGPLCLVGWSSGGLLAYEIALQQELQNMPAVFLSVIDEFSPSIHAEMSNEDFAEELFNLIDYFSDVYGFSINFKKSHLTKLPKNSQITAVFNAIPISTISAPTFEYIRHFLLATLTYKPTPLQKTGIVFFTAQKTLQKFSNPSRKQKFEKSLGWSDYSKSYITTTELSGDHFSIIKKPDELSEKLNHFLLKFEPQKALSPLSGGEDLEDRLTRLEKMLLELPQKASSSFEAGRELENRLRRIEKILSATFFNQSKAALDSSVQSEQVSKTVLRSKL